MNIIQKSALAAAIMTSALASTMPAYADCRGFFCGVVKDIPVVGPAAEGADQFIAGVKERGSTEDALNQGTTLNTWNNPIGRPAGGQLAAAPPPPMGIHCATNFGIGNQPAFAPLGSACFVWNPRGGQDWGNVIQ